MNPMPLWFTLCGLLALSGCSSLPLRFPWQSKDIRNQSGNTQPFDQKDSKAPSISAKNGGNQGLPVLIELADSGLQPVGKQARTSCAKSLALPLEQAALAHPSNFGKREKRDGWGRPLNSIPQLIVLHETVISGPQTVAFFQTNHPEDDQQASYHLLIDRDGSRLRIVPDEKRAYGSGMSAFGDATQRTKPSSVGSINNIALHVSLVSPSDGRDDRDGHSGYTEAQYKSLAGQVLLWQAGFGIPMTRVTTHAAVDRSHSRYDPRSFRWDRFDPHYRAAAAVCGFPQFDNQQAGL
ncbi:N-acetylmuramoyl-L-alanine amidase [Synechococcus sp. Cruz-9H2]|nr:N-acetylmuramoyl-L-alanine amidase [Synechococcus sp. Cruz-9H2]MCP9844072.1 N-acetylmuramoyl-L-alanine amidase [Synechococcus sp. Edmonson 11F2]MCP9856292.1 N-acetylmuramoyl-L-alanine amidase [Synechococcus sp. Cruz-9C9]MCP9863577.1 N-acetylmuramoyl-L-alanine amidase [Synechococcus sp. Cruz-7E5]MCP9870773.1 N-acetylmuramoyl-L-alanine amidase [Synechococcus sp. Cruz-7B9]